MDIANRRAFDQGIDREWRRAARNQRSLALLMVDVDRFKQYNDQYGHAEGDECLKRVATALEVAVVRPGDLVARYGGEEMAVLLPETDLDGAVCVAERIHRSLADEAIPFPDSPDGRFLTVSIGAAAILPRRDLPPTTLVEEADAALYAAKQAGRNQTASSRPADSLYSSSE